jgi:type I restriction-modification system DNA methylase subunit
MKRESINRDYKKRFMNGFRMLCKVRRSYTVWSDCMALFAITIANTSISQLAEKQPFKSVYTKRENEYKHIINTYTKKEQKLFPQMFALLIEELERQPNQDLLGELYMLLQISNKNAGQFFTPYRVCQLMGSTIIDRKQIGKQVHKKGYVGVNDCACGAGATLISVSEQCKKIFKKYNYQNHVYFTGQDIDITCVHMCYIQLSLHGLAGYVIHDNTLTSPEPVLPDELEKIWFTPVWFTDVWTLRRLFHDQDIMGRDKNPKEFSKKKGKVLKEYGKDN